MEPGTSQLAGTMQLPPTSRRGVALVIVLAFLVLITVLIVAFLSSVTTEYSTATTSAAGATGRELADASVQLVMGQIRQATSLGSNVAWASQPGMIRTYGSGTLGSYTASSAPLAYYKLYSSDNMVVDPTAVGSFAPSNDVPGDWNSRPAVFTDLNAPVTSAAGTLNYPIIDPRAADVPAGKSDPMVEGFSITGAPTAPVSTTNPTPNLAPMPTKWIYVLRDGTLTAPVDADSTATVADFKNASTDKKPTVDNPIVGRIAFWTDDETCKLNLNTACGGTYWEDPMFSSDIDLAFSRYKPVANEFNRYPGHPATTSLLPVFWSLDGLSSPSENFFPVLNLTTSSQTLHSTANDVAPTLTATNTSAFQNLLQLSPRNVWGGSKMSTDPTAGNLPANAPGLAGIVPDSDRIYSSVDEAIFGYTGTATQARGGLGNALAMSNDNLKRLRFFLTTTSRSPETNPFNQPKVGIWPVPELLTNRSMIDKLIAFCSTLKPDATQVPGASNNFTYFFTRNNAQSSTADFQPGSRNDMVFDYLDAAFQKPIPGFGASIDSRYTVDGGRRILALIYDYIRSTINLVETSFGPTVTGGNQYKKTFLGVANNTGAYGFGQVVPIKITKGGTTFKGAGRFPLIKEVAVMFMARASNQPPLQCTSNGRPVVYDASGNVISDASGNILPASYPIVFAGLAQARLNPQHPWVAGTVADSALATTYVNQLQKIGFGHPPVMAIDTAKFAANPNDPAAFLPVFGNWVSDDISGSNVASITAGGYTQYPTLYGTTTTNGKWGVMAGSTGSITIGGTPYTYCKATSVPTSPWNNPPQTHAGMPYLTVQSPDSTTGLAGAFVVPNPRYQGKNINPAYELPDPANLPPGSTEMQTIFLMDPVNVSPGAAPLMPKYQATVAGLDAFSANGANIGFGSSITQSNQLLGVLPTVFYGLGLQTISIGASYAGPTRTTAGTDQNKLSWIGAPVIVSGSSFAFNGGAITLQMFAPLVTSSNDLTNPITTDPATLVQTYNINFPGATFPTPLLPLMPDSHGGAQWNNELFSGPPNSISGPVKYFGYDTNNSFGYIPNYPQGVPSTIADLVPSSLLTSDAASSLSSNAMVGVGGAFIWSWKAPASANPITSGTTTYASGNNPPTYTPAPSNSWVVKNKSRFCYGILNDSGTPDYFLPQRNGQPTATEFRPKLTCDTIRAVECLYGDPRVFASLPVVGPQFFAPHRFYSDTQMRAAHTFRGAVNSLYPADSGSPNYRGATEHNLSDASVSDPTWSYNPWTTNGTVAARLGRVYSAADKKIAPLAGVSSNLWADHHLQSHSPYTTSSSEVVDSTFTATGVWSGLKKFSDVWNVGGDFCNGLGPEPDGPYINKPNEAGSFSVGTPPPLYPEWSYFSQGEVGDYTLPSQFSPNRLIASPVAFGSLPTPSPLNSTPGTPSPVDAWHTLLFCANPNASTPAAYATRMAGTDVTLANQLPSGAKCPDHLLLDFFAMPVVEPYAISEPFSTAGKVNMNYQIAPFTYIKRETALRGVFRGTMLAAVNDQFVPSKTGNEICYYKSWGGFATATDQYGMFLNASGGWGFRYPIHAGETLKQFQNRFDSGDLFRSPSEICSLFLYPAKQPTATSPTNPATALVSWDALNANILAWWYGGQGTQSTRKSLTGDNLRERPYATLYPRLTTKSNSYTVHFRVQVLKKSPITDAAQWVEAKDMVASEYRGSSLIERYIDPSDPSLLDFADPNNTATLDDHYKFRVVSTKKFTVE